MKQDGHAVLVVDDKKRTADNLSDLLKTGQPDWLVETASHEADALQRIRERLIAGKPFSVVITDLDMNNDRKNGIKLIKAVQSADPLAMTILYTGYPEYLDGLETLGLPVFDVIIKAGTDDFGDAGPRILTRTRAALRYRDWAVRISFLRRYFDPNVFETIEKDPSLLEPRTREVTVAFWDIRGFSALCEQLKEDPDLIAGFLRQYCELAAEIIFDDHGILDKFMGDGVMGLFGFLDQTEEGQATAAASAVNAAISLRARFGSLVQTWLPKWQRRTRENVAAVTLGCGIHTARALVGNLGTDFRDQFTAVGAHVNFAQRLESLAGKEPGADILVSQPTSILIEGAIPVSFFKEVNDVKNVPGNHRIFRVRT